MKQALCTVVLLGALVSVAAADEFEVKVPLTAGDWMDASWDAEPEAALLEHDEDKTEFSIGPAAGYLSVRDADRGTWFGGVQMRLRFMRYLAVEGAATFHRTRFEDGDYTMTQYPVQVSALVLPFARSHVEPYGLVGAGWYYTRIDIDSSQGGGDETDRFFGWHLGAGVMVEGGHNFKFHADFRWIFLDEDGVDNSNLEDEDFDFWMVTLGAGFIF